MPPETPTRRAVPEPRRQYDDPAAEPPRAAPQDTVHVRQQARYAWAALRIALAWVFLWAFLDKAFGLGFSTARENAWLNGGSPTRGFLTFGTQGPFAETFQAMAGNVFVDSLFMIGLLGIGLALALGIGMRIAALAGSLLLLLMWLAALLPANNPFLDDHIVYAIALWALVLTRAGETWGLGAKWRRLGVVQKAPVLE